MEKIKGAVKTIWSLDQENCDIGFSVQQLMISHVKGSFKTFDARIYTIGKNFKTAEIDFWIETSSITTNDVNRDKHLKSVDFFNVKKYKQIRFNSSLILKSGSARNYELWGELTMMGITKILRLDLQFTGCLNDRWGNERVGFNVTGIINRTEWGLTWNKSTESGDLLVSDEVSISCEVELTKVGKRELAMQF